MASHKLISPCFFLSFLLFFCTLYGAQTVPAVYVFGDSLVDVGNNDFLSLSLFKANFPHNGIDFPGQRATGRFCNGKNAAAFLAEKLGLLTAPPYLSQPDNVFRKGVNFASGGAGIFNTTDEAFMIFQKYTVPLSQQVGYFSTVQQRLVKEMGTTATQKHLSKSIFAIVIGSNDIISFFDMDSKIHYRNISRRYVALMVSTLKELLQSIYNLGAQKFLLVRLSPLGCALRQRYPNTTNECNEEVNYWSKKYNKDLTHMLPELQSELNDFHCTYFDIYNVFLNFIKNPTSYGFNEVQGACCGLGKLRARLHCVPLAMYCSDRSSHIFWDIYHPTETAARIFINKLFNDSGNYISPIVQQLLAI